MVAIRAVIKKYDCHGIKLLINWSILYHKLRCCLYFRYRTILLWIELQFVVRILMMTLIFKSIFFKFISIFSIVIFMSYYLQINMRWMNWKKGLFLIILINVFLSYLIFTHFIMVFLGYLTDPIWYQKNRPIDYIQLSHGPSKWGNGLAGRDHFTYHSTKTVFWFKNDGPFASSFVLFHMFLFLCLFMLYFYWITLFRRVLTFYSWATLYFNNILCFVIKAVFVFLLIFIIISIYKLYGKFYKISNRIFVPCKFTIMTI